MLREAIDELRENYEWAVNNVAAAVEWIPARRITSMPVNPCAPDWSERLNRFTPSDVRQDSMCNEAETSASKPQTVLVRAEDFARAMEDVEQLVYCCASPNLQWTGDPESPGIECIHCGYVIAQTGELLIYREESEQDAPGKDPPRPDPQRQLF